MCGVHAINIRESNLRVSVYFLISSLVAQEGLA